MIKYIVPIALMSATVCSLNACKSGQKDFQKLEGGLEYKIVKDAKGDKSPANGDVVELHVKLKVDDSLIADSRKENNNQPIQMMIQPSQFKGDWTNGLTKLTVGDSAVFRMSVDSLKKEFQGQMLPPFMETGKHMTYEVVLVSIKSQQQLQQEQDQHASQQKTTDENLLQEYFTKNNLQPNKTGSGLYYIIEREGKGEAPKSGQAVTVNYTGRTLDGKVFDSNTDPQFGHVEPFTVNIGRGEVIPGWDEGLTYFKKGSKGKLFIPSAMAYGPAGREPQIPKDAILVFDIEVVNIAASAPQNQQMPVQ